MIDRARCGLHRNFEPYLSAQDPSMQDPGFPVITVAINPNVQHMGQPPKHTSAASAGISAHQPMIGA